ncbi:hypothetical protein [Novosphingobium sp.]|uniref:hypothetical protein n=2 Tax=unclassified Novosphingobium TaxID=2644732 RepID=UPI0038BA156F
MQFIKYIFAGILFIWLLSVASCAMLGTGTVMVIDSVANSDTAKRVARRIREDELKEHNERANHESYHDHDDYEQEYYDK